MSDEPKPQTKRGRAFSAALLVIAVLVAYQTAHYATATCAAGATCEYETHQIGGEDLPPWANDFFLPAERFDQLIGVDAFRSR